VIERLVRIRCDLCGALSPIAAEGLELVQLARKDGWRSPELHYVGIFGDVCRECGKGRTDDDLYYRLMAKED
jgi:hypothetical protein